MLSNVYSHSPILDLELREVNRQLHQQYLSAAPDLEQVRRLARQRQRLKSRYGFDYTVLGNWLIFAVGAGIVVGLAVLLKAIQ